MTVDIMEGEKKAGRRRIIYEADPKDHRGRMNFNSNFIFNHLKKNAITYAPKAPTLQNQINIK